MTSIFFILTALFSTSAIASPLAQSVGTLECKAIHRTVNERNHTIEVVADIPVTFSVQGVIKYQLDMNGRYFSITEHKGDSILAQIISGPDFTKGPVSRGLPDAKGSFNLTEVDGTTIFKIECRQLPQVIPPQIKF